VRTRRTYVAERAFVSASGFFSFTRKFNTLTLARDGSARRIREFLFQRPSVTDALALIYGLAAAKCRNYRVDPAFVMFA